MSSVVFCTGVDSQGSLSPQCFSSSPRSVHTQNFRANFPGTFNAAISPDTLKCNLGDSISTSSTVLLKRNQLLPDFLKELSSSIGSECFYYCKEDHSFFTNVHLFPVSKLIDGSISCKFSNGQSFALTLIECKTIDTDPQAAIIRGAAEQLSYVFSNLLLSLFVQFNYKGPVFGLVLNTYRHNHCSNESLKLRGSYALVQVDLVVRESCPPQFLHQYCDEVDSSHPLYVSLFNSYVDWLKAFHLRLVGYFSQPQTVVLLRNYRYLFGALDALLRYHKKFLSDDFVVMNASSRCITFANKSLENFYKLFFSDVSLFNLKEFSTGFVELEEYQNHLFFGSPNEGKTFRFTIGDSQSDSVSFSHFLVACLNALFALHNSSWDRPPQAPYVIHGDARVHGNFLFKYEQSLVAKLIDFEFAVSVTHNNMIQAEQALPLSWVPPNRRIAKARGHASSDITVFEDYYMFLFSLLYRLSLDLNAVNCSHYLQRSHLYEADFNEWIETLSHHSIFSANSRSAFVDCMNLLVPSSGQCLHTELTAYYDKLQQFKSRHDSSNALDVAFSVQLVDVQPQKTGVGSRIFFPVK
ncbi:hypothetical protein RCL1_007159 [Eukaryota sp. TZLM3-RCL]